MVTMEPFNGAEWNTDVPQAKQTISYTVMPT